MKNIIGNLMNGNMNIDDKTIALAMLAAAKEAATIYLDSALTSTTPELRGIYSASLTQMVAGHTAVTKLCLNKGWIKPYEDPAKQLACSYKESKKVIAEDE